MKSESKPKPQESISLSWDNELYFEPTPEFIEAIKNLMIANIKMMRVVHKDTAECWYCGSCEISDVATCSPFSLMYGGKEDCEWVQEEGQIFVTVPFE